MLTATLATLLAAPVVIIGALLVFRALTAAPDTGRHRITGADSQYRPRSAALFDKVPVVPAPQDPAATAVTRVRDMAVPVPMPTVWRQPIPKQQPRSLEIEALMNTLAADVEADAALTEETQEVTRVQ